MAQLLPEGRYIVLSMGASSSTLYCSEISFDTESTAFTRIEKTHDKLKNVPENTGAQPTFAQSLAGFPVQFIYSSATTARNLLPDDADLGAIEQKLFYNKYTLTGATSLSSDTALVFNWAAQGKTALDRFDAYQKYANDNVSYQYLVTLAAETFSYLTTTGISLTSSTLGNLSNVFIQSFTVNPTRDIQGLPSGQKVLYDWTMELRQYSIKSAASLS